VNSSPGLKGIEEATNVDVAGKIIQYVESDIQSSERKKRDKIGA